MSKILSKIGKKKKELLERKIGGKIGSTPTSLPHLELQFYDFKGYDPM